MMKIYKRFAHNLFQSVGYDFMRFTPENFPQLRRKVILDNERIDLVLDVGANEGNYGLELRKCGYANRIISFEPLSRPYLSLTHRIQGDSLWECENRAIGKYDGEVEMNISGRETSSSILQISRDHILADPSTTTVAKETVKISRLDSLLEKSILPARRIYLKADVQGYELQVMQGAMDLLKLTHAVELELSLTPMYEGAPDMAQVIEYMKGIGFKLVSMAHVFSDPASCYLLQIDGIFVRR